MVSNDGSLVEGLPADWTVQLCALKTGRKVKHYVNLRTGKKLVSKDEVLQYIGRQNTQVRQPQGGEIVTYGDSKTDQINPDRNKTEPPEWLPPGWTMELKPILGGAKRGGTYKCYVDLSSGHRCYSKPQVFRYLKEHKTHPSKTKETLTAVQSEGKATDDKTSPPDLPPGWIMEFKIRKRQNGLKRDPYYTDPVNGYIFRSKKDVLRYIETGEISKHAISPKKRHITENASMPPIREKLEDPATRQQVFTAYQSSHAGNTALSESEAPNENKSAKVSTEIRMNNCTVDGFVESDENYDAIVSSMPKAKDADKSQLKNDGADNGPISTAEAGTAQEKFSESWMKKDRKVRSENSSRKSDGKGLNSHCRSSRRLAGLQPELVSSSPSSAQAAPTAFGLSEESLKGNAVDGNCSAGCTVLVEAKISQRNRGVKVDSESKPGLSPEADIMQEQSSLEGGMKNSSIIEDSLSKSTDKIGCKFLGRSSKRLAGLEPELASSSIPSPPEINLNGYLIDYGAQSKDSSNRSCLEKPKLSVSYAIPGTEVCADDEPVSALEANMPQQDRGKKSSRKKTPCGSRNSLNKGIDLPRRSSKRISGLEALVVANSVYSVPPLQNHKTPANKGASAANGLSSDGFQGETSKQLKTEQTTLHHATEMSDSFHGEPPNTNQKSVNDQANPVEQSQDLESAKTTDGKPEPPAVIPNGDFLSDPCIEFAFKTLIGEIPVVPPASNGPIETLSGDISKMEGNNESGAGRSSGKRASCNKKAHNWACRSSKRLAGLERELVVNSLPSIKPLQHGICPGSKEDVLTVGLTLDGVKDEASKQLKSEHEMSILNLATYATDTFKPPNMSQKPLLDQVVSSEHSLDVDVMKTNCLEPQSPPAILQLLSDPCIEFAIKTLTGEIPIERATTDLLLVSTPACDILSDEAQTTNDTESYNNGKTLIGVRKSRKRKELNLPRRSSKRIAEAQLHQLTRSGSSECALHMVAESSRKTAATQNVIIAPDSVDELSQQLKVTTESSRCHGSTGVFPMLHMEPSNVRKEPYGDPPVTGETSSKPVVENVKIDKLEKQSSFSFGDFWSDPCIEFAFKTLTGAISVEDYLPIEGYFQQQVNASQSQKEGNLQQQLHPQSQTDGNVLPDFGLPGCFQADISAHFDTLEKQLASQPHFPSNNPPLVAPGNVSLPSCTNISSQEPHFEGSKGLPSCTNISSQQPHFEGNKGLPSCTNISSQQPHFEGNKGLPSCTNISSQQPHFEGNKGLPSCTNISYQQPHFEGNKGLGGKVKS